MALVVVVELKPSWARGKEETRSTVDEHIKTSDENQLPE